MAQEQLSIADRVYAIGDVHGRFDLLERLMAVIERDSAARIAARTRIVLLGNIVDRGPQVREVVERCRALTLRTDRFVVLRGYHEYMMAHALRGSEAAMKLWLQRGGGKSLATWGISEAEILYSPGPELIAAARAAIGENVLEWLAALPLALNFGQYFFVHAGIRPNVKLAVQSERDLLSIGKEFLTSDADHGAIIVHGHSIHESGPDYRANRIGIDSGAYRTGRLTALGVEEGEHWALETAPTLPLSAHPTLRRGGVAEPAAAFLA